jgi:hypothetical protein
LARRGDYRNQRRLPALINDVINFSRLEAGRLDFAMSGSTFTLRLLKRAPE